jgi:predicted esterase
MSPPIRLVHGQTDARLPLRHVQRQARALRDAGHEVHLRVIPEAGHRLAGGTWRAFAADLYRAVARARDLHR